MQRTITETAVLPLVSLVMPIRNEGQFIAEALGAALAQDYPADRLEVIVADGMSTDDTRQIVRQMQAADSRIRLIDNEGQFVATGLNVALRAARGEIIARVDGHCVIAPDYVRQCVRCFKEFEVDAVGGPIETVGATYVAQAIALAMSSRFGVGGATFRTVNDQRMLVESLAFPAFRRRAIERAGFFDEELVRNQDDEYNYRLVSLGGRIMLAPEIRSRYYSRSSLRSLWRQYYQYGFWKVRVMQKHFAQMRLRQFIPAVFVGVLLIMLLATPISSLGAVLLAGVAGFYWLVSVWAAVLTCGHAGQWRLLPLLPLTFAILHVSYGLGFLTGMLKFWNRWGDRHTHAAWEAQQISALRG